MIDRTIRILLVLTVLFVATGAALAMHCHEEGHAVDEAHCQICHWLMVAVIGLIIAIIGIWMHTPAARRVQLPIRVMPRSYGRPRCAASRAPPLR